MPYSIISYSICRMAYSICDLLYFIPLSLLLIISAGGLVYYLLAIVAARKLCDAREDAEFEAVLPEISMLKPLRGADPDLERHLESFFLQGYPSFEILFAVR